MRTTATIAMMAASVIFTGCGDLDRCPVGQHWDIGPPLLMPQYNPALKTTTLTATYPWGKCVEDRNG